MKWPTPSDVRIHRGVYHVPRAATMALDADERQRWLAQCEAIAEEHAAQPLELRTTRTRYEWHPTHDGGST